MIATVGTFDGVHIGHKFLLETLSAEARRQGRRPLVLVLVPHPLMIVAPERAPKLLTSPAERADFIEKIISEAEVATLNFDGALRSLTHREFMLAIKERYGVGSLLLGYDNRFGSDRNATPQDYVSDGREIGIEVRICDEMPDVSSSLVRKALMCGDISDANAMLGRHYRLPGVVAHGNALGRKLGFPTANLHLDMSERLVPANGVYACMASVRGSAMPAVVNIGYRPTVSGDDTAASKSIEAHIVGFDGDIYGESMSLSFIGRLREEKKFPSTDALVAQIKADVEETVRLLK